MVSSASGYPFLKNGFSATLRNPNFKSRIADMKLKNPQVVVFGISNSRNLSTGN